ncbi:MULTISPECIES: cupin domain-containing protein [Pseudoalteromonas]|uniref:Cupin domain-containing protein n=1 Tax=Pseudoalteromonas obscura TaxID=3048491 RepID=A0ABT7EJJ3_9GAMM|nr:MULTISPECIES: cupin domain-containing protein [Pseudoalteromonas]MBQ4836763.1 cupin domain-containing protein [Pseudoalteromonas luteoviolacea]MDK2595191.1 cupin domain-containing protein [Pseudoalteromonas sp. P94(2023)]
MNDYVAVNLAQKLALFEEHWSPKVIGQINDYQIKVVKVLGEFTWHQHDDTDELFLVLKGRLDIHFENRVVTLNSGEMLVVKKGEQHKPVAEKECEILLIEPKGVVNTGDAGGKLTAQNDIWI